MLFLVRAECGKIRGVPERKIGSSIKPCSGESQEVLAWSMRAFGECICACVLRVFGNSHLKGGNSGYDLPSEGIHSEVASFRNRAPGVEQVKRIVAE